LDCRKSTSSAGSRRSEPTTGKRAARPALGGHDAMLVKEETLVD
jgi:hypothetical protein